MAFLSKGKTNHYAYEPTEHFLHLFHTSFIKKKVCHILFFCSQLTRSWRCPIFVVHPEILGSRAEILFFSLPNCTVTSLILASSPKSSMLYRLLRIGSINKFISLVSTRYSIIWRSTYFSPCFLPMIKFCLCFVEVLVCWLSNLLRLESCIHWLAKKSGLTSLELRKLNQTITPRNTAELPALRLL